eukprot:5902676-Karenia_brevis.AAC.1
MDSISASIDAGRQSSMVRMNKKKYVSKGKGRGKKVATQGKVIKGGEAKSTGPDASVAALAEDVTLVGAVMKSLEAMT